MPLKVCHMKDGNSLKLNKEAGMNDLLPVLDVVGLQIFWFHAKKVHKIRENKCYYKHLETEDFLYPCFLVFHQFNFFHHYAHNLTNKICLTIKANMLLTLKLKIFHYPKNHAQHLIVVYLIVISQCIADQVFLDIRNGRFTSYLRISVCVREAFACYHFIQPFPLK